MEDGVIVFLLIFVIIVVSIVMWCFQLFENCGGSSTIPKRYPSKYHQVELGSKRSSTEESLSSSDSLNLKYFIRNQNLNMKKVDERVVSADVDCAEWVSDVNNCVGNSVTGKNNSSYPDENVKSSSSSSSSSNKSSCTGKNSMGYRSEVDDRVSSSSN